MALNTYPYSPFPASTEQLHKGDNEELQAQIDAIKDGTDIDSFGDVETALGVVTGNITNLENDKADLEVVAEEFDAEAGTYDVGDLVTHEGKIYEFTSAHSTAGAWDPTEVTEKTVADEIDSLKSGLTNYKNQNNLNLEVPDRKNVLPNGVKSGSYAGVEWTLNDDGSITFNGTATQQIFNKMYFSKDLDLPAGEYIYNGGSALITFQLANKAESQSYYSYADYSGYIEVTQAMVGDMIARLIINNGTVLNNVTIYPMIRPKSIESGVYAPYIPSVESRIDAVENKVPDAPTTDGTYNLQVTVSSGTPTYSWVSGS